MFFLSGSNGCIRKEWNSHLGGSVVTSARHRARKKREENRDNRSLRMPNQTLLWNLKCMCQNEHWTLDEANKMLLCYRSARSTAAPETCALWLAERQPGLRLQQTCGTTILFSWQLWRWRKIRRKLWWIETMLSTQMASSAPDARCYESMLQLVCQVISYHEVGSTWRAAGQVKACTPTPPQPGYSQLGACRWNHF